MAYTLYAQSISDYRYMTNQSASERARQTSKDDLMTQDLDKLTERLCPLPKLEVAHFRADERTGKRVGNTIHVSIPFHGDLRTFQIKPSRVSLPNVGAELHDEVIVVVFPDDQNLDKNVDALIELMNKNIDSLRVEWATLNAEAKGTCRHILEARKNKFKPRGKETPLEVFLSIDILAEPVSQQKLQRAV